MIDAATRARSLLWLGLDVRTLEVDDECRAVLDALDRFESRDRYDVRIPGGHKGGGRFRKLSDVVFDALTAWSKGEGPDNPFDSVLSKDPVRRREQIREVAKARGITLRRGEPYEEIANKILDDVRAKTRTDREAPKPSAKFTLQGPEHHNLDVAVYRQPGSQAPELYQENDAGKRGALVQKFDNLEELAKWADANGEPRLAEWARKESGAGKALAKPPKPSAPKTVAPGRTSMSDLAAEAEGLQKLGLGHLPKAQQRKQLRQLGYSSAEIDVVLKSLPLATPASMSDLAAELEQLRPELSGLSIDQQRARLRSLGYAEHEIDVMVQGLLPNALPVAKAVKKATPNLEQAARDRQAAIDSARTVADTLAEVDQLVNDGASVKALQARLDSRRKLGAPSDVVDELAAAAGDRAKMDQARADIAKRYGLTPLGSAGAVEPFDPNRHEMIGGARKPRAGTPVQVVRPGHEADINGEKVQVGRAGVMAAAPGEAAKKAAPTKADFEARVKRARKGNAATAAVPYRFTGTSTANADVFADPKERTAVFDAFYGYKGIGSRRINQRLRDGQTDGRVAEMDKAFAHSHLTADVVVWRGSRGIELGPRESWPTDLTGREWTDQAFVSTSPDVSKAEPLARDGVLMRIVAPEGTPAVHLRSPNRVTAPESEILLGRGLSFRVVADHGIDEQGRRRIDVEVIPSAAPFPAPAEAAKKASPRAPKLSTSDIIANADLTPGQKRARLRARGMSKEEIDALVPLLTTSKKAGSGKPRLNPRMPTREGLPDPDASEAAREIVVLTTERDITSNLAQYNVRQMRAIATRLRIPVPKQDQGQPLTAETMARLIAHQIIFARGRSTVRSESPDPDDIARADDLDEDEEFEDAEDVDEEDESDEDEFDAAEEDAEDEAEIESAEPHRFLNPTARSRAVLMLETRALGHDVTPGHDELHHYWTRGEGLAKWKFSPKPWTTLVAHLTKYVGPERAKVFASRWFHEVFGFYAGSDLNRVTHGKPPRGHRIGPG